MTTSPRFGRVGALAAALVVLAILGGERPAPAQSPSPIDKVAQLGHPGDIPFPPR
jgi:hypothetical protein